MPFPQSSPKQSGLSPWPSLSPSSSKPRPRDPQPDETSPRSLKVVLKLKVKNTGDGDGDSLGHGRGQGQRQGKQQDRDGEGEGDLLGKRQNAKKKKEKVSTPAVDRNAISRSEAIQTSRSTSKREREVVDAAESATHAATKVTPRPKTRRTPGPKPKSAPKSRAAPKSKARSRANAIGKATSTSMQAQTPTPTLNPASRRRTPIPTATPASNDAPTITSKQPVTARRHRRGRPRNVSLLAAAALNAQLASEEAAADEEREREAEITSEHETSLRFKFLSDWTFPVLVDTAQVEATVEESVEDEGGDEEQHKGQTRNPRRCVGCGVSEPAAMVPTATPGAAASSTRETRPALPMTPPWSDLNLRRTRHVNVDTLSTRDLVITRTGKKPNTLGFWYDMTVAEQAMASEDLDFKMMCLGLIWGREKADFSAVEGNICQGSWSGRGLWDCVLREGVEKGKMWRRRRRLREREREKAARWAVWEEGVRNRSLGEFVEDTRGAWVVRAPGFDGPIRKMLKLGYKRIGIVDEAVT